MRDEVSWGPHRDWASKVNTSGATDNSIYTLYTLHGFTNTLLLSLHFNSARREGILTDLTTGYL